MVFRSLMRERTPDPQSSLTRCCAHSLFVWNGICQLHREVSGEELYRPGPIALPILGWKKNHWDEDRIVPCTSRVMPSKKLERSGATPIDLEKKVAGGRCESKNRTNERPAATNQILIDILYL